MDQHEMPFTSSEADEPRGAGEPRSGEAGGRGVPEPAGDDRFDTDPFGGDAFGTDSFAADPFEDRAAGGSGGDGAVSADPFDRLVPRPADPYDGSAPPGANGRGAAGRTVSVYSGSGSLGDPTDLTDLTDLTPPPAAGAAGQDGLDDSGALTPFGVSQESDRLPVRRRANLPHRSSADAGVVGPGGDSAARDASGEGAGTDGFAPFSPFGSHAAGAPADAAPSAPATPHAPRALPAPPAASGLPALPTRSAGTSFDAFGGGPAGAAERIPGASGSFDGFAAGAGRTEPRALPVAAPGLPALPAGSGDGSGSLFDSSLPVPRMTRPARDPLGPELGAPAPGATRVPHVVAGDFFLTVNSVDGTEIVPCPPQERRTPVRRTRQERSARMAAARPAPPPGPPAPELPLLERDEERERLVRLLARGRSVRVTGASGAGRTALLETVAQACGDLAPEGVLRLSGYRRTAADVLQDLYTLVYATEGHRPGREELPGLLRQVGAVVVLDDLEFGGTALEEVLAAAPECAFLMSATPDVPAPAAESMVEEVFLSGLTRTACVDLLQLAAGRRLEEDEAAWAADLWFESEGLPLRFVQAGALLRQRDALRTPAEPADWDDSVWEKGVSAAPAQSLLADLSAFDSLGEGGNGGADSGSGGPGSGGLGSGAAAGPGSGDEDSAAGSASRRQPARGRRPAPDRLPASEAPLPSLAESAAPATLLASRLSESAREALAFAVALDGECPHPAHLPALVGDTHGDAALGELTSVGLAVPVAGHFRLAAGVTQQLAVVLTEGGELSGIQAHTAALHYSWWAGHPSVTPERAASESEAILAAMTACRDGGQASAAVLLARTVAPVFAAALHWGAWERALRVGQEAARLSGEVAEEAYFHHELGVLALCTGGTERARAELEASIALRGALADRQGTIVGRRTLALVADLEPAQAVPVLGAAPLLELPPAPEPATVVMAKYTPPPAQGTAVHAARSGGAPGKGRGSMRRSGPARGRRNLVAAGTGVVIAAVVGTIVAIGAKSGDADAPSNQVQPIESVEQDAPDTTTVPPADGTTASPPSTPASSTSPSTTGSTTATPPPTTPPPGGDVTTPPPSPPASTAPAGDGRPPGGGHTSTTKPSSPVTTPSKPSGTPSSPSGSDTTTPTPTDTSPTTPTEPPGGGTTSQSATTDTPATALNTNTPDSASPTN